jgi:DNA processing protein
MPSSCPISLPLTDPRLRLLAEIADPPARLHVLGDADALARPAIAVVGTRLPSPYGTRAAIVLARALARHGFVVTSGLARGIDAAAHRAALACGGTTVAVLGHGLGRTYPADHTALAAAIARSGCLVTEYAAPIPPLRHHFPARNRLISGLSWGTLVVEAAHRSGSLITARLALEQNRGVYTVPARFDDPGFGGNHQWLQQGAKLVASVDDILAELPPEVVASAARHAIPERAVSGAESSPLRRGFADGVATVADLRERCSGACRSWGELWSAVTEALRQGWIYEVAPHTYLWVG